jgi:hypothetical protein
MTYKETLFFVAKCLTISLEEKNREEIEGKLQTEEIDWDAVVKVSTGHYVFPALYCNLKRVGFLKYVPAELVEYMKHITDLNRERNILIIEQAKELNQLLTANNITPIFLKGTGNLLEGLYDDVAERMVGDIDFIFSKNNYSKATDVILKEGYISSHKADYIFPKIRHYPRLVKDNNIAAVEIHKKLILEKFANEFNYFIVSKDVQKINEITVLSFENQLALSIFANQINDDGYQHRSVSLRNGYDVFLLSKKTNALQIPSKFKILENPLNCFLAICYHTFGKIPSLEYNKTRKTEKHLKTFNELLLNDTKRKLRSKLKRTELFIKKRLSILYKALFDKELRIWVLKRISDKNWQREKMVQLGFKKMK